MISEKFTYYIDFGSGYIKTDIYENKLMFSHLRDNDDIAVIETKVTGSFKLKGAQFTLVDNISKGGVSKDVGIKIYRDGDSGTGILIYNGFFNKFNDFDYNKKEVTIKEFNKNSLLNQLRAVYDKDVQIKTTYRNFFSNLPMPIFCNISYAAKQITDESYSLAGVINMMIQEYSGSLLGMVLCNENDFWYNPIYAKFNVKNYRIANLNTVFTTVEGTPSKMSLERLLEILRIMHKIYWYIDETQQYLKFKTIYDLDPTKLDLSEELLYKNRRVLNYGMNIKSEGITLNDNNTEVENDNYTFEKNKIKYTGIATKSNDYNLREVCTKYSEEGENYNIDGFFFALVDPLTNKMISQSPYGLGTNFDNCEFSLRNLIYKNYRDYIFTDNINYSYCDIPEFVRPAHLAPFIEVPDVELVIDNIETFIDSYISEVTTDNKKIILVYEQSTELETNLTKLKGFEFANSKYDLAEINPPDKDPDPADTLSVNPTTVRFDQTDGMKEVELTSNTSWIITNNRDWITITPMSGTGNETLEVTITPENKSRSYGVPINTDEISTILLVRESPEFRFNDNITVSPSRIVTNRTSKIFDLQITSDGYWTVVKESWMTLNYVNGTGNTVLHLTLASSSIDRIGYLTFTRGTATSVCRVEQTLNAAALDVSPPSLTFDYNANTNQLIYIVTNGNWTITSSQPSWVNALQTSGTGNTNVLVHCSETIDARTAILTISNGSVSKTVNIVQTKRPTFLNITPYQLIINNGVEQLSVPITINSNATWVLTFSSNIHLASGANNSNFGNGTQIRYIDIDATLVDKLDGFITATCYDVTPALVATIAVKQYYVPVPVSLNVSPLTLWYPYYVAFGVNIKSITITTTGTWTVASNQIWLTSNVPSGTGNAMVNFTATQNNGAERTAIITVSNGTNTKTIAVTQEAYPTLVTITVTPTLLTFAHNPLADLPITITTTGAWTIQSNAVGSPPWIYPMPSDGHGGLIGSGNATVDIHCDSTIAGRTAKLTITNGQDTKYVDIVQTATPPFININLAAVNINNGNAQYMPIYISSNIGSYAITVSNDSMVKPDIYFVNSGSGTIPIWIRITATTVTRSCTLTASDGTNTDSIVITQTVT